MFSEKEYQMATEAKTIICKLFYTKCAIGEEMENLVYDIADFFRYVRKEDPRKGINRYAMQIAALSLFHVGDNGQYWIPSTRSVLEKYRKVKKALKKGTPVTCTFWEVEYYTEDWREYKLRIA